MAENTSSSAFITLEEIVKGALRDTGESNTSMYQKYVSWSMDCVNELGFDALGKFKRTFLGVDPATMTAKLPDDYVQYVAVGLRTQNKEFVPMVYNPSLIINPTTPTCDALSDHCDCGCNDELCYAIGQSNVATESTTVTINGTNYTKTVSVCTSSSGEIMQKTCAPVITNVDWSNYSWNLAGLSYAQIITVNLTINGTATSYTSGSLANINAILDYMNSLGYSTFTLSGTTLSTTSSPTYVWRFIDPSPGSRKNVTQTDATPIVTEYCYEEKICDVEVLECGCIVPTQTTINTLTNCCSFVCAVTSRQLNNKDFGQTFAQPKGYFGEYKVDLYEGIIQVNTDFQYDTIYLEYYSANEVDSKYYLLPVQCKQPIIAWIYWQTLRRRKGVSPTDKKLAEKDYYNEKRKLKQRLHPLNMDELLQAMRVFQRP